MGKLQGRVARACTLYVRQLAWLQAVPKPPEGSKRAKLAKSSRLTRAEQYKNDGIAPAMPPNPAPHIIRWLIEMGITQSVGNGPFPLNWVELEAWQRQTGVVTEPWVARLLINLSRAFVGESHRAESENAPSPWQWEKTPREREAEAQREIAGLKALFG